MDRDTFEKIAFPYNKAQTEIQVNEDERKQKYDAWKPESELEINDHLYIRNRGLKGINKIQSKWKPKYIYIIVGKLYKSVYCVECEKSDSSERKLI